MRNFAITDDYVVFIPGNAVRGGSVWRLADWPGTTDTYTVTLQDAGTDAAGAGEYAVGADVYKRQETSWDVEPAGSGLTWGLRTRQA